MLIRMLFGHAMKNSADRFVSTTLVSFIGVLFALIAGGFIGDMIPHEHRDRLDHFIDIIVSVVIFLTGIGLGIWRRLYLAELWVSLALVQLAAILVVGYFTDFTYIFWGWLLYVSLITTLPFLLSLLLLYGVSFIKRSC
jgi:hypothetical protein